MQLWRLGRGLQRRKIEETKKLSKIELKRSEIDVSKKIGFPGAMGSFTEEAAIKFLEIIAIEFPMKILVMSLKQ